MRISDWSSDVCSSDLCSAEVDVSDTPRDTCDTAQGWPARQGTGGCRCIAIIFPGSSCHSLIHGLISRYMGYPKPSSFQKTRVAQRLLGGLMVLVRGSAGDTDAAY